MKKIKAREIYVIYNWISSLKDIKDGKFAYALGMNKKRIKDILIPFEELPAKKAFSEYSIKLRSVEDRKGAMFRDEKVKPEDREAKIKEFDKESEKITKDNEGVIKDNKELLDTEIEFEPYMVNKSEIPNEIGVTSDPTNPMKKLELQDVMEGLLPIIRDEQ